MKVSKDLDAWGVFMVAFFLMIGCVFVLGLFFYQWGYEEGKRGHLKEIVNGEHPYITIHTSKKQETKE